MLFRSCGRPALMNGSKATQLTNSSMFASYRTPRFSVSLFVIAQSSCAHQAATCRGAYSVKPLLPAGRENGELVIATLRRYTVVTGDSGARFHVVTSLTSTIMFWITSGESVPLFDVNCPMQVW